MCYHTVETENLSPTCLLQSGDRVEKSVDSFTGVWNLWWLGLKHIHVCRHMYELYTISGTLQLWKFLTRPWLSSDPHQFGLSGFKSSGLSRHRPPRPLGSFLLWFLETQTCSQDQSLAAKVWLLCVYQDHSSSLPLPLPLRLVHMGFPSSRLTVQQHWRALSPRSRLQAETRLCPDELKLSHYQFIFMLFFLLFIKDVVDFIDLCLYYWTISFWIGVA